MNDAIRQGRNFSSSNTSVQHDGAETFVYLHGNHIATVRQNSILLFDGGWQSNTTKSRLNAILNEFRYGDCSVFQKNFTWFLNDRLLSRPVPFFSGMTV